MNEEIEKLIEELEEYELSEKEYDELLDSVYPTVSVLGLEYYPSTVLKQCDITAYNMSFSEEEDYQKEQMKTDIETMIDDIEDSEEAERLYNLLNEAW